ncbi:hypothetical protein CYY_008334 [Polysphondylium violaceum]|uniref:NADH:flavin oxidoreductase/NADH oxidase N-terminal domain-containing protein n=1 Tax=Polysphondylium violaceum TaxID=133409 RepID=A0A8J4PLU2_9MYCE|nr:hypothetical protein CYY_008334 [Polysphondylium violaceum]
MVNDTNNTNNTTVTPIIDEYKFDIYSQNTLKGFVSAGSAHGENVPLLFKPLKIKDMELKNRIVVSPMCQYSSQDGFMNDWHLAHLSSFARGGAGLVIFEATAVNPEGRISYADSGLWKDDHIAPLKRINNLIHSLGSKSGIQIGHAGRKASSTPVFLENGRAHLDKSHKDGWEVVGPSPVAFSANVPHELTVDEIQKIVEDFRLAAIRALKAGFDFLEIHGAHGYLVNNFLSPVSNKRTDAYGGDLQGRSRFLFEVIKAVRSVWPTEKPLGVRLSCIEWVSDGWSIEDTVELSKIIKNMDIDLIDCSTGGNVASQKIEMGPLYQVPFAERVKKEIPDIIVGTVGLINTGTEAESILQSGKADLVMLGRAFLRNPHWPYAAAKELNANIDFAIQYTFAK